MAEIRDIRYHCRVYAEYNRRGPEFGASANGLPDMDYVKPSVFSFLLWSMAGMVESGSDFRSEDATDVHLLYHNSDHRMVNVR
jgi:hypothetical protein